MTSTSMEAVYAVPAFADTSRSWPNISLRSGHQINVIDLPGVGRDVRVGRDSIEGMTDYLVAELEAPTAGPIVLIGHSLGSAIAVAAAQRLGKRVVGLISLEGNLTTDDGYFSATASDHADPQSFVVALLDRIRPLVDRGDIPRSYLDSIRHADATTLWCLGRDAARRGADDAFGRAFVGLRVPTRYLWSVRSTPSRTQEYLLDHHIDNRRNDGATHWPFERRRSWVVGEIESFMREVG